MKVIAIIVAAGKGERFGGDLPKQYLLLCGKPLLAHTLLAFEESRVDGMIVVVNEERVEFCHDGIVSKYHLTKVKGIVSGGNSRQESVYNGFKAIVDGDLPGIVIVHDGVRPLITKSLIEEVIQETLLWGAAVAAIPVDDTIKLVNEEGVIERTIDRRGLWSIQTPQGFRYELLKEGFERAIRDGFVGSDEAILVERLNHRVRIVRGLKENIKITTRDDLILAESILEKRFYR